MRQNILPHTNICVSELCLGTMIFGDQLNLQESLLILDSATKECGINFLDTAELYPVPSKATTQGRSDEIIATWLGDNPSMKDKVVLSTKVVAYSTGLDHIRGGPRPTKKHFRESLEASLLRLKVEVIDLFQIHWPARNTPMFGATFFDPRNERAALADLGLNFHEQAEVMNDFIQEGKIRAWGLSNENTWGVMSFLKVCEQYGLQKPSTLQNAYSLVNRTFEQELWETCFRENIGFLPYSPLAMGHLTGKYLVQNQPYPYIADDAKVRLGLYKHMRHRYNSKELEGAVKAYAALAKEHEHDFAAMSLAFVNQRPFVTSNIIGVSSREQLLANMQSLVLEVDDKLLRKINKIHQQFPNPSP